MIADTEAGWVYAPRDFSRKFATREDANDEKPLPEFTEGRFFCARF